MYNKASKTYSYYGGMLTSSANAGSTTTLYLPRARALKAASSSTHTPTAPLPTPEAPSHFSSAARTGLLGATDTCNCSRAVVARNGRIWGQVSPEPQLLPTRTSVTCPSGGRCRPYKHLY